MHWEASLVLGDNLQMPQFMLHKFATIDMSYNKESYENYL